MEERTIVVSVFMLCLVIGMLAEQSRAEKSEFDKCYDLCFEVCLASSMGDFRIQKTCTSCDDTCDLKVNNKACILFWCWQVKWCWNCNMQIIYDINRDNPLQARRIKSCNLTDKMNKNWRFFLFLSIRLFTMSF